MSIDTRDGIPYIQARFSGKDPVIDGYNSLTTSSFSPIFNVSPFPFLTRRDWKIKSAGGSSSYVCNNIKIDLESGTNPGYIKLESAEKLRYPLGAGNIVRMTLAIDNISVTNNFLLFGYRNSDNGFYFKVQDGDISFAILKDGVEVENRLSANWDHPFELDTNLHSYEIQSNIGLSDVAIFVDGIERHTFRFIGQEQDFFPESKDMHLHASLENSGSTSSSVEMSLYRLSFHTLSPGIQADKVRFSNLRSFHGSNQNLVALSGETPVLMMEVPEEVEYNHAIGSLLKRYSVSSDSSVWVRIYRNAERVGGNSILLESASDPAGTPTNSALGTNASYSGYSDGDTVSYKISVIGTFGETLPSPASTPVSVGTPAKQIQIDWDSKTNVFAYGLYRQLNGAGNFERIAVVDRNTETFVDDGYFSNASITPSVSSNASGDAISILYEGFTLSGGNIVRIFSIDKGTYADFSFDNYDFLNPGETLAITMQGNGNGVASLEWQEGPY